MSTKMPKERFMWRARESFLGSDWMENCKVYGPGLANKLGDVRDKLDSVEFEAKSWFSNGIPTKIKDARLRKTLDH